MGKAKVEMSSIPVEETSPLEQSVLDYLEACEREFSDLERRWFAEGEALEKAEVIEDWAA